MPPKLAAFMEFVADAFAAFDPDEVIEKTAAAFRSGHCVAGAGAASTNPVTAWRRPSLETTAKSVPPRYRGACPRIGGAGGPPEILLDLEQHQVSQVDYLGGNSALSSEVIARRSNRG